MNIYTLDKLTEDLVFYGVAARSEIDEIIKLKGWTHKTIYTILGDKTGFSTFQELRDYHNNWRK